MKPTQVFAIFALLTALHSYAGPPTPRNAGAPQTALPYEQEFRTFAEADRAKPPVPGGILFVGSSIFRQWTNVAEMMAPLPVLNRAFGGSLAGDQLARFEQVVSPYAPKVIVYYCGSNDLKAGELPDAIFERFKAFSQRVREALPETRIVFVSSTRSPDRVARWDRVDRYNSLVRDYCTATPHRAFIDINPVLFDREGKPRLELYQNDNLHLRPLAYVEFAGVIKPVVTRLWQEAKLVQPPVIDAQPGEKTLERLVLSLDRSVLNPVREQKATAKLTITGIYQDGSHRALRPSEVGIKARTKNASGNVDVVTIEGAKVVPKEGGIATIEATIAQRGRLLKDSTDVVVAPFYRDYHQTLVLKLFLGMEGEPVERLAKEPLFQKKHDVICTFEEALEVIQKTDNLTRGIPKIVYLIGWQKGGHDHGYPAWDEVNPRMKRKQDATALSSLRWLIREARRFNTTVSLHLNMVDAYRQSPVWDEYVAKDCLAKDASGQLQVAGIQIKREEMYNVVYPREWEAGLAQRRIDRLIAMIPELKAGHTIHIDVFIAQREDGQPISPWHAKPEHGGLTPDQYVETQRRIFHYWRERGFDVTGEGIFWAHPPGEGFTGLQAMSWWYPSDTGYQMQIPECLMARGRTDRGGDGDFRFGSSMHGEEIYQQDKDKLPGFLGMFCRTTLPWYYLSRLERKKFENEVLFYSDGVVAQTERGKRIIRKGDFILHEDDNLFVPALWHGKEIIAYSKPGYEARSWRLPDDWRDVKSVDLYQITIEGCLPLEKLVPITDGKLVVSLDKDEAISIVPAGTELSGRTQK